MYERPKSWRCKDCHDVKEKLSDIKYNTIHRDNISTYYKIWYEKNKEYRKQDKSNNQHALDWKRKNPEKVRAHNILRRAIRSGKIIKPTLCLSCGINALLEGHHLDYYQPLEVLWLCKKCHKRLHGHGIFLSA